MPVITKCTTCGFEGNHGFINCLAGITKFYHTIDENKTDCLENSCQFYEYDGKTYPTLAKAWKVARESYPNDYWRQAYDALILDNNQRKHNRLIDKWREEVRNQRRLLVLSKYQTTKSEDLNHDTDAA